MAVQPGQVRGSAPSCLARDDGVELGQLVGDQGLDVWQLVGEQGLKEEEGGQVVVQPGQVRDRARSCLACNDGVEGGPVGQQHGKQVRYLGLLASADLPEQPKGTVQGLDVRQLVGEQGLDVPQPVGDRGLEEDKGGQATSTW